MSRMMAQATETVRPRGLSTRDLSAEASGDGAQKSPVDEERRDERVEYELRVRLGRMAVW
jgi:hypothetical protein